MVIKCNVYRKKEIGMVSLKVSGDWNVSRGKIKFTNGQEADITVILVDSKGIEHKTFKYGESSSSKDGQEFNAYFSNDLDKGLRIEKIIISSSIKVDCERITWYCYNPI